MLKVKRRSAANSLPLPPKGPRVFRGPLDNLYVVLPTGVFWLASPKDRRRAYLFDLFCIVVCIIIVESFLGSRHVPALLHHLMAIPIYAVYFCIIMFLKGETFGYMIVGLRIVAEDGHKPKFHLALLSYLLSDGYAKRTFLIQRPPKQGNNIISFTPLDQGYPAWQVPPAAPPPKYTYERKRVVVRSKSQVNHATATVSDTDAGSESTHL